MKRARASCWRVRLLRLSFLSPRRAGGTLFYKGGGPSCGSPARPRRSRRRGGTRRRAPGARACRARPVKRFRSRRPGTDIFAGGIRSVARRRRTRPTGPGGARSTGRTPLVCKHRCGRSGAGRRGKCPKKQTRHVNFYLPMITELGRSLPLYPGISFWLSTTLLNIGGFIVGPPGHQTR